MQTSITTALVLVVGSFSPVALCRTAIAQNTGNGALERLDSHIDRLNIVIGELRKEMSALRDAIGDAADSRNSQGRAPNSNGDDTVVGSTTRELEERLTAVVDAVDAISAEQKRILELLANGQVKGGLSGERGGSEVEGAIQFSPVQREAFTDAVEETMREHRTGQLLVSNETGEDVYLRVNGEVGREVIIPREAMGPRMKSINVPLGDVKVQLLQRDNGSWFAHEDARIWTVAPPKYRQVIRIIDR